MFGWLDANRSGAQVNFAATQYFSDIYGSPVKANQAGSAFRNIAVIGDRSMPGIDQNALTFYGKTSFAYIDNIVVSYMKGTAFAAGFADTSSNSWGNITESRIQNAHFDHDGDGPNFPTFEITAANTEGSNNIDLLNLRFYDSFGTGMLIHQGNVGTNASTRAFHLLNLKFEDSGMSNITANNSYTLGGGDMLQFSGRKPNETGTYTQQISDILCRNVDLVNPVLGYAALHVAADAGADASNIDCEGSINGGVGAGYGRGLQIDGCQQCAFREATNDPLDYGLQLGAAQASPGNCSSASITAPWPAPGIVYDAIGFEPATTTCLDPASAGQLVFPVRQILSGGATTNISASNPPSDLISLISTNGNATFTTSRGGAFAISAQAPVWTIIRSGSTTNFTDSWDSAANFVSTIGSGFVQPGQIYRARVCNQTLFTETLAGNSTVSVIGTTVVQPGTCLSLALTFSSASALTILGG